MSNVKTCNQASRYEADDETSPSGPSILGSFELHVILATTVCGPRATANAIKTFIDSHYGETRALSAVLTTLDRLANKGLLETAREDAPAPKKGGKKRRLFRVTDSGDACLEHTVNITESMARLARQKGWGRAA